MVPKDKAINELSMLDKFCKEKKELLIYGAGYYAEIICAYLKYKKIKILGFCISDTETVVNPNKLGYPVAKLSELKISKDAGIILGLNSTNQAAVMRNLKCIENNKIYKSTDQLIDFISKEYAKEIREIKLLQSKIDSIITMWHDVQPDINKKSAYDTKIKQIKERYKQVTLVPAEWWIGGVIEEYACMLKFGSPNPDEYWLFIPSNPKPAEENDFTHPNEYIFYQMQGEGFSSLTMKSLPFWKYFLKKENNFFQTTEIATPWKTWLPQMNRALRDGTFTGDGTTEYIKFSDVEEKEGQAVLKKMGLSEKYVSLFSRDACYAKSILGNVDKYRKNMDEYRNSDFATFFQSARNLNDAGIKTVRIGKAVREIDMDPCIVDYANKYRSDFMDFYLAKYSYFFLGDPSGIQFFYSLFGKPFALTNYGLFVTDDDGAIPLTPERDLVIYHKFWSTQENRNLTLSELLDIGFEKIDGVPGCNTFSVFEKYKRLGIVPISNTAEEISDLAQEMVERMTGNAEYTDEDDALQEKYFSILRSYVTKHTNASYCNARIGREFLRKNLWLTK